MKKILILCILIIVIKPTIILASYPDDYAKWWVKEYGLMETNNNYVIRAHEIFDKLLNVADKSSKQFPSLVILRQADGILAKCIKDGTVLLTRQSLSLCFDIDVQSTADSQAAFIIAHELAHMAFNDFDSDKKAHVELKADNMAILYMTMAGYDPQIFLNEKGKAFFVKWYKALNVTDEKNYPCPEQRAKNIIIKIKNIIRYLDYFKIGVRFYQLGKYEDAIEFFNLFRIEFPSREVFSNIGLSYYNLAMIKLLKCDDSIVHRFKLSTMFDSESIAELYTMRKTKKDCNKELLFKEASRYLRKARDKDPFYLPALINYSSTLIMLDKYSTAMSEIADTIVESHKSDPKVLNNLGIAMYLLKTDPLIKVDMTTEACKKLQKAIKTEPEFSNPYYNLGRIVYERYRNASYKEYWTKYLHLESSGFYTESIRKIIKIPETKRVMKDFFIKSPVNLGIINKKTEKMLISSFRQREFDSLDCVSYTNDKTKVISLAGVVEIVEKSIKMNFAEFNEKNYGKPKKTIKMFSGKEILVYYGFAMEVTNDVITRVIFFEDR